MNNLSATEIQTLVRLVDYEIRDVTHNFADVSPMSVRLKNLKKKLLIMRDLIDQPVRTPAFYQHEDHGDVA